LRVGHAFSDFIAGEAASGVNTGGSGGDGEVNIDDQIKELNGHSGVAIVGDARELGGLDNEISVGFLVLPWTANAFFYLDVVVNLPASYETYVYGMAGYFDGVASNDLTGMDGTVYTLAEVNAFAATWAVPTSQNLWLNPSATFSTLWNDGTASPAAPQACYVAPPPPTSPPKYCEPIDDPNCNCHFSQVQIGNLGWGKCNTGFTGHPSRQCEAGGVWGPLLTNCS